MQLDTETGAAVMKASAQSNAIAEEATRRVVELMQDAREYRERIAELEQALKEIIERWDTPLWKDVEPTGAVINRARAVLNNSNSYKPWPGTELKT